jgi:hypothetical protein
VAALMEALMGLGVYAASIRWHVSNPGRHVVVMY